MTLHTRPRSARGRVIRLPLAAAAAGLLSAASLVSASAALAAPALPPGCAKSGPNVVSCVYTFTGGEQTFTVPHSVHSVSVVANGAAGAASKTFPTGAAGLGAKVTGSLSVTQGEVLYVEVGGTPTGAGSCTGIDLCNGGFNGGGNAIPLGGGGGGASDVRTISRLAAGTLASRAIIAGGGGGSGGAGFCLSLASTTSGGAGGNADAAGGAVGACLGFTSTGGGAGNTGGAGGVNNGGFGNVTGQAGVTGQGGNAVGMGGGGGGGGTGGGAGADTTGISLGTTGGSGGGGGSSVVPPGGAGPAPTFNPPGVLISYTVPPVIARIVVKITGKRFAASGAVFTEKVTVTNYGPDPAGQVLTAVDIPRLLSVVSAPRAARHGSRLLYTEPELAAGQSVSYLVTLQSPGDARATVRMRAVATAGGSVNPDRDNKAIKVIHLG